MSSFHARPLSARSGRKEFIGNRKAVIAQIGNSGGLGPSRGHGGALTRRGQNSTQRRLKSGRGKVTIALLRDA
jgi:hypothetical protein